MIKDLDIQFETNNIYNEVNQKTKIINNIL